MIYRITRFVIRLGIRGFFNKIHASGAESINASDPAIIIANHPSALIDPLVIATITDRKLYFLTAAEYFGKGLQKWLLAKEFNMIPVYRPKMYEGQKVSNKDMFRDCYKCLNNDGCIVIFPEGNSVTEKHLRSLKTGVARILVGFQKQHPDKDVKVIPVGLNYSAAHQFQSDVFVCVGEPISFSQLYSGEQDSEKQHIQEITEALYACLKSEILHFNERALEPIVEDVEMLWANQLHKELGTDEKQSLRPFRVRQKIIEAAEYLYQQTPKAVLDLGRQISTFIQQLKKQDLTPEELDPSSSEKLTSLLKLIFGFPLFVLGLTINCVPYFISKQLFLKKLKPKMTDYGVKGGLSPAFAATLIYSVAMVVFLFWLILIGAILSFASYWWCGILFFFGSYYLGRFSLKYLDWLIQLKKYLSSKKKRRQLGKSLHPLIEENNRLIRQLNEFRRSYEQKEAQPTR